MATDTKLDGDAQPNVHFDNLHKFATEFSRRDPGARIDGLKMDAAPRWDFWRGGGVTQFDTAEAMYVARSLEFIRPGVYAKKYPTLFWTQWVPANYNVDTGAEAYTVTGSDYVGQVNVSRLPSSNMATTQMRVFQQTMGFFSMTEGYVYNLQEVRNAIFARQPLQTTMAMNVRNVMERKLDEVALIGETSQAVKGLFTLAGTDTYTIPATGAGGLTTWESKAPDGIVADLMGPLDQMIINTNDIERPDTLIMATSRDRLIGAKRMGDGSDSTVKKYFLANQEFISDIKRSYRLEAAPNVEWTGKRNVYYRNDAEVLEMVIPQAFEQLPPVAEHFTVTTICHVRTGGVALHLPKAVSYADNV